MGQPELAKLLNIGRERLASYEYARAPVRYSVGRHACLALGICQRWLATGVPPVDFYIPVPSHIERGIESDLLFSDAYEQFLKELLDTEIDRAFPIIAASPVSFSPSQLSPSAIAKSNQAARRIAITLSPSIQRLPDPLQEKLQIVLIRETGRFLDEHSSQLLPVPTIVDTKKEADSFVPEMTSAWTKLLERLRTLTSARGSKAELARHLGLTSQAVTKWFSGRGEPSAEMALRALEWVEQREKSKGALSRRKKQ